MCELHNMKTYGGEQSGSNSSHFNSADRALSIHHTEAWEGSWATMEPAVPQSGMLYETIAITGHFNDWEQLYIPKFDLIWSCQKGLYSPFRKFAGIIP